MPEITYRSDMYVKLVDFMGDDDSIVRAMMVSTKGVDALEVEVSYGRINFLMKNRHGTPFEHASMTFYMEMPIFVFREFHRHRIGWCLPGSSKINVGAWKNGLTKSIENVYRDWHEGVPDTMGRRRKLASTRNLVSYTLNTETGLIEQTRMVDVFKTGIKPITRIELASGRVLRASPDHLVYDKSGQWVKIKDLVVRDVIARKGRVAIGERQGIPPRLREGIQFWTTEQRDLIMPIDSCYVCGSLLEASKLELDHVIPVVQELRLALDRENLKPICSPCHQEKTNSESSLNRRHRELRNGARYEHITSIRNDGEEMCYDIEMPGPWHNFIADDFIVHNSYNEMSGRYRELPPTFYVPGPNRNLVQVGKAGAYEFVPGTDEQYGDAAQTMGLTYRAAYEGYQILLNMGVAKEVARIVLPVGTYSAQFATCNPRSLMAFLSLRTKAEPYWVAQGLADAEDDTYYRNPGGSMFPSFPQREIEMVAEQMEQHFYDLFPMTYQAFCENGRVAP